MLYRHLDYQRTQSADQAQGAGRYFPDLICRAAKCSDVATS
jgi:hypothetical protein